MNDDRLYRALDRLSPYKDELEQHLRGRLGTLFKLDYDLLLYDVTSTYFEGQRMEQRYGSAERIWVVDRGMVSEANLKWL